MSEYNFTGIEGVKTDDIDVYKQVQRLFDVSKEAGSIQSYDTWGKDGTYEQV